MIGYQTANGRRIPPGQSARTTPRPQPMVQVLIDNKPVGEIERRVITRFSFKASAAFPPPVADATQDGTQALVLDLRDARFRQLPSVKAVTIVLEWMEVTRETLRGASVIDCALLETPQTDSETGNLCDIYGAPLLLNIHPAPHAAFNQLTAYIEECIPNAQTLKTVHQLHAKRLEHKPPFQLDLS